MSLLFQIQLLVSAILAVAPAQSLGELQIMEASAYESAFEVHGRLVDVDGEPIPEGTRASASLEWYDEPRPEGLLACHCMMPSWTQIEIGENGRFHAPLSVPMLPGRRYYLRVSLAKEEHTRRRVFIETRPGDQGTLTLLPEECIASGPIEDESGHALPRRAYRIDVKAKNRDRDRELLSKMKPRVVPRDGRFEVYGWLAKEAYTIQAWFTDAITGEVTELEQGSDDLLLRLPDSGCLQAQIRVPDSFPPRGIVAYCEDLDRGVTHVFHLLSHSSMNMSLRAGRYHVSYRLNGAVIDDFGVVTVDRRRTNKLPVRDYCTSLGVIRVEVLAPDGEQIPAARVRVNGSDETDWSRERNQATGDWIIPIAYVNPTADLKVYQSGQDFESREFTNVSDDLVVTLATKEQRR